MQIPYSFQCIKCNGTASGVAHITARDVHCTCSCGYDNRVAINTTIKTGIKLLYKAGHELDKNNDFTLSILLSVMAFEAEQFRLYKKWHVSDHLKQQKYVSPEVADKEIRDIFQKMCGVRAKINTTFKKGSGSFFNEYVSKHTDIVLAIKAFLPQTTESNFLEVFHEALFKRRNDILHGSKFDYSKEDADAVYFISRMGMYILWNIDQEQRAGRFNHS